MPRKSTACLTCKHVKFIVPTDWKPSFSGETYDRHDVIKVIRETEHHVDAQCTLDPKWVDVTTAHYCGRWDGLCRVEDMHDLVWGSWIDRAYADLTKEVEELKQRLKQSQSISAGRLARLKSKAGD